MWQTTVHHGKINDQALKTYHAQVDLHDSCKAKFPWDPWYVVRVQPLRCEYTAKQPSDTCEEAEAEDWYDTNTLFDWKVKVFDDEDRESEYEEIGYGEKNAESEERPVINASILFGWKDFPDGMYRPIWITSTSLRVDYCVSRLIPKALVFFSPDLAKCAWDMLSKL